ncbi:MAG: hypothetical protein ACTSSP_07220 [Candidatus Asgardarchaeia archaeon]
MEYKCKMLDVSQLNVSPQGFIFPLCETCQTQDCSHPIEKMSFSIVGVKKTIKVHNRGSNPKFIVECEGYIR